MIKRYTYAGPLTGIKPRTVATLKELLKPNKMWHCSDNPNFIQNYTTITTPDLWDCTQVSSN